MNKPFDLPALSLALVRERAWQADGSFLAAWAVAGSAGNGLNLAAQRFDAQGAPLSGVLGLARLPAAAVPELQVLALADGGYAVAWRAAGADTVALQRLTAEAAPLGSGWSVVVGAAPGFVLQASDSAADGAVVVPSTERASAAVVLDTPVQALDIGPQSAGPDPTPLLHGEERVNTFSAGNQLEPQIAVLSDGRYVITWQSNAQDGSNEGIYAQLFAANGRAVGPEFRVNTQVTSTQEFPHIAGLSQGGFVIVWQDSSGLDGSSWSVVAQRYDSAGVAQGGNFVVNTTTSSGQYHGVVAAYTGGFAVAWASDHSGTDVYLKRYDNSGSVVLAETLISTAVGNPGTAQAGTQYLPSIAARADGSLVLVWEDRSSNDGSGYGVYARLVAANNTLGGTLLVNTATSGSQYEPDLVVLADGGFVVVWRSDTGDGSGSGVYGQRFDATGTKVGGEFLVNTSTSGNQYMPAVTGQSTGGFSVTWYSDGSATGTSNDVFIREYDAAGSALGAERKLNSTTNSTEYQPTIADLGNGNLVVAYADYAPSSSGGNDSYEIVQQIFGAGAAVARSGTPQLGDFAGTVVFGENLVNGTPQLLDPAVSLTHTGSADFGGGQLDLYFVQGGQATDQLGVRHQGNGFGQIGVAGNVVSFGGVAIGTLSGGVNGGNLVVSFNANATVDAVEALVQNLTYGSSSQSPAASRTVGLRVSDGDGGSSVPATVTVQVTPELDGRPLVHAEEQVNSFTVGNQTEPEIAVLADGSYVITWQSTGQDGAGEGVYFQRFAANGTPIGPELRANAATGSAQEYPHVAALSDGGFVLVWQDNSGADGSGWGVVGQRYDASGVAQGGNFVVNTFTSNSQYHGVVASYGGGFAVAWTSTTNAGGNGFDIYLKRYDNSGTVVLAETRISTVPGQPGSPQTSTQELPDIASDAAGNLVIVWQDAGGNDGSGYGVYLRTVSSAGVLGDTQLVNTRTTGNQYEASVAMLAGGGFVVVWGDSGGADGSSWAVYGQRFDAAGTKVGAEFLVNETTAGGQYQPAVMAQSGGGFVVSWFNDNYDVTGSGSTNDVYIREYNASGVAIDGQRKLGTNTNTGSNNESQPALADLGNGNFVVAFADYVPGVDGGNDGYEITQQIFGSGPVLARQAAPSLGDFAGTVVFGENLVNTGLQPIDASVAVSDADSANLGGGRLDLFYVQYGEASDQLGVRHQGNAAGQIGVAGNVVSFGGVAIGTFSGGANGTNLVITFNANATVDAVEALVQNLGYASSSQSPAASRTVGLRLTDGDGGASTASTVTINVTRELDGQPVAHGEERVNTYTASNQTEPEVATLADGSYVITWQSTGQDGAGEGVYFQRFAANGTPIGPEQRANTATGSAQEYPHVAALSDGGFVLVWQDQSGIDGSGWGVIGQRYDATGTAQGGNFVVNTHTGNSQYHGVVASYSGGFAVAWTSTTNAGGNGFDIYLKRYDNSGTVVLAETRISAVPGQPGTAQTGTQELPDIASDAAGNLVIVWQDTGGNDSSGYGVYARTVSSAGVLGNTVLVNTTLVGNQYEPAVAMLAGGGFVVVWGDSSAVDGSGWGVYGQRFDAAGNKLGGQFLVNETTAGSQYQPTITALSTGGFVVSWFNDNYDLTGAGSYNDVYIREYDAAGVALDGQRKLEMVTNTPSNTESQPAIADLGNGNFVVAYADYVPANDGGNATYEITQQIFGSGASLARQSAPVLGDFTGTVVFSENLVNGTPQVIDASVSLSDADSANLGGGRLDLFYVQGGETTDQLGVRHQGNAAGQIGVAGNVVSFGGVAIGTFGGGNNGSNLVITFNASATVDAVEALLQNLSYASSSQSPAASRTVGLRVTDGDGGATAASTVTIQVTSDADGAPLVHAEQRVNSHVANTQESPEVAVLADGSYVITWQSYDQDSASTNGVYFQRFAANGNPLGLETRANTATGGVQEYAQAAALSDGGFVLVWQDQSGIDGSGWGVIGQRYDASGVAQGGNFVVNSFTSNSQLHGVVAGYSGGFAVAWTSTTNAGGNGFDIYLKRYDNSGTVVLAETRISTVPGQPGTPQTGTQELPDIASDAAGNLVIVWQDTGGNDSNGYGVYARTVSSAGVLGNTVLVNTTLVGNQYEPAVAMLAGGGFVVVWGDSSAVDGSGWGVYGQRFDAAGNKLGGQFLVNETTAGSQYQPTITALSTGGFVVSWFNDNYDLTGAGSYNDVYIREYDAAGVALDGQRKLEMVTNTPSNTESQPAIADLGNGNFVVAYADYVPANDGGNATYEITQQIFGSGASLARGSAPVLGDLAAQRLLSNTLASPVYAGNAQLVDADLSVSDADTTNFSGSTLVLQLTNGATAGETLALRHVGNGVGQVGVAGSDVSYGGVVVGTLSGGGAGGSTLSISFNSNASAEIVRAVAESVTYQNTAPPAGTTDRYLNYRLTDGDGNASVGTSVQLRIQATVTPATLVLDDVAASRSIGEADANIGVLVDDAVQLVYTGAAGFNNGRLNVSYQSSTGRPADQLAIRHEGDAAGQVGVAGNTISYGGVAIGTLSATLTGVNGSALEITFNASATDQAIERVIENLRYSSSSEDPNPTRTIRLVVTDGANVASPARDVVITIAPEADPVAAVALTGDLQANSYEAGGQSDSAVARLLGSNDGGYVIAWTSDSAQDGSGNSVQLQRFDANGQAVGAEIRVNSYTLSNQYSPAVDGITSGGFVVAWVSSGQDGSGEGVYAQRFDASGQRAGGEFRVNTSTVSTQTQPAVLGLSDGTFLVTYASDYVNANNGYTYDVLAQRYAANGTALGAEFLVNTNLTATQNEPQLARLSGGGFVATWQDSSGADGSGWGIIAQRFANDGSKLGPELVVNTTVTSTQESPDVAGLADGGFVVAWHYSNNTYAQRFDAAGNKVGGEILVSNSDAVANYNTSARVTALDSGGFVVSWDSSSVLGGSSYDVVAQQFNAAGERVDGIFVVNTQVPGTQIEPDLTGLAGSNFVVSWSGYDQERAVQSTYGVFHKVFGSAGSIASSAAPVLVDVAASVVFDEAAVNAAPQRIDASVGLSDLDSANFDGGRLWVSVVSSYPDNNQVQIGVDLRAQDQLSLLSQGSGPGQVDLQGSNVRYGGVVIGTVEIDGANGRDLVVRFNASASSAAVEAVIEQLAYANTTSDPGASRTLSISVSDGDGATSTPSLVTVTVTPQADGPAPLFGNERVNTYLSNTQDEPSGASLSDGSYVIVWASEGQDGASTGVFGQRFSASGERLGAEFSVNTQTLNTQASPQVTGLNGGGYVVTWQSQAQDGSSWGVYAQRFANDGTPQGNEFRVNTTTAQGQYQPAVTATADGGFVVAWYYDYYNADFTELGDVYFQRYAANGTALGAETRANPAGLGTTYQYEPAIAGLAGGGFVVLWRSDGGDGSSAATYGQVFNASGVAQGSAFLVNTYTDGGQYQPDVAALEGGGFVATWYSDSQDGSSGAVFAQRFDAAGNKLGAEFRVHADNQGNQSQPAVTSLAGGGFAISWIDDSRTYVQQFAADGSRIDGNTLVDRIDNNANATSPDVFGLDNGGFVVAWRDYDYTLGSYDVYQQVFADPALVTRQAAPVLADQISSVSFAENAVNAAPQLIDGSVDLSDADSANFDGGQLWVSVISGYGDISYAQLPQAVREQDQLSIRHEGNGATQVGVAGSVVSYGGVAIGSITSNGANGADLVVTFNANASEAAVEAVIENLAYGNSSSAPVGQRQISISVSDGDGATSTPRLVSITVVPEADGAQALFGNEIINTYRPGTQDMPAVTALNDGGYVVTWASDGQDGWDDAVHAQRFDANGVAVGSEFKVNTYTPYSQQLPAATQLADGGYVIAWQSSNQDGSGLGVFGQRFDANGVPVGDEFLVNSGTSNGQSQVSLAGFAGGGFIATWYSDLQNGEYYSIYAQRFDANGAKLGPEFKVDSNSSPVSSYQAEPTVATFADGGFVIAYRSDGPDGAGAGVYAQRYAANGSALGAEFRVSTYGPGNQYEPSVTALDGGGFVVVWHSDGSQDGSSGGIFGQRYAADGSALGTEFRVNTDTTGNETDPAVTALSGGGFAVTYYDSGRIAVQQFAADGSLLDNETRVDTHDNNGNGSQPAIAGLANGAFVVVWTDYDYNDSTYQIFQQLFANPAQVARQANPELVDVATSVTFRENLLNAVPQLIDPGVGLFDADSADFDGGLLEVNYITGYGAQDQLGRQGLDNQDQLGIRHEGSGPGQVGVAGSVVSYGGVAIGSIVSNGANGNKLSVQFNANATVDAVEQVIEALTYANTVSNPILSRTVSIRVTDGDGGASVARSVTINVTAETDGAVRFGLERTVNTTVAGNQYQPDVSRLADGGYVVTWEDSGGADGSGYGVYAQRYDANDNAVGGQLRVNTYTSSTQSEPQVQALAGGGFVIVWSSNGQDGSGYGVYAQRYGADGVAQGGEFRVSTLTTSSQYQPSIAATADGGFIVAYYHDGYTQANTEYADIFFQRFDANGTALGVETRANPLLGQTFLYQSQPSIAVLAGGDFVISWTDNSLDGNGDGVFAQRFAANGTAQGSALQVNSYTASTQQGAKVTALADGGFLVTWQSQSQDLSSWGVYAQRFDANGAAVGAEFRVNTSISGGQYDVDVTALENGGWVVAWYGDQGSNDIYLQQYNAAGAAVDGETIVNSYTYSTQGAPAIESMADGGFVVAWHGYIASGDGNGDGVGDGGNDTYEIRLQRFSNTAPEITDVSVNGLEDSVLTLSNTLFETGFNDPDGQTLQAIKIITLPGEGTLRLNGVAVVPDQEISLELLQAGALTYQGNADYFGLDQFRWTGSDGISFASTPVFTNINLSNVNDGPRLEAGADDTAAEGTFFSHNVVIADPDPEGHRITVDWGDGSAPTVYNVGNTVNHNISHYFADNGVYTVTVTADDQRSQANSVEVDSFQVTVANVAPTLPLVGNNSVVQDEVYTLDLGNVNDPGTDTVTEYRIDWGDGSPVQVVAAADLPANRELTHVFSSAGQRTISVALVDEDGSFANAGSKTITVAPPAEVITVSAGADRSVNEGTTFTQTINFTDPTDQSPAGRSYSVDWGDGSTSSGFLAAGQLSFNIAHAYADDGQTYSVLVTVDDNGFQQGSDSFDVTVNNVAPTLTLAGASNVAEGSVYTMTLNVTEPGADTITEYSIDWGDGSAPQVIAAADLPANRQVSHVYADGDSARNITVQVVDEDGTWANAGTRSVFVNNVAPTAPVSGAATVVEGQPYTLTVGAVAEPGQDTRNLYSIDWGDGTVEFFTVAEWAAAAGSFEHVYTDGSAGGTGRTVTVRATDEDGSFVLGTQALTVSNAAPELAIGGAGSTPEGAAYVLAVSASEGAGGDTLSYSIDWGDGSAVQLLSAAELAALGGNVAHVFTDDEDGPVNSSARLVSVTVSDGDGGSDTETLSVNVFNVAPTAALSGADTVAEGGVYTLSVGAVTDPGADTRSSYNVAWGDGSVRSYTPAEWAATGGILTHTYADGNSTPTIVITATDEDGTFVLGTKTLTVQNLAPTLALAGAASTAEGSTYQLAITGNDAGGAADPLSYDIDWGDGSAVQTISAAQLAALGGNVGHVFADDQDGPVNSTPRTITVTASDGDGGSAVQTQVVAVLNVAPTIALGGAASVQVGQAYTLNLGAITDPGQDTVSSIVIDWGDGTVESIAPAATASHTYTAPASRSISVGLVDEDGSYDDVATFSVDVLAATPTVSLEAGANVLLAEGSVFTRTVAFSDGEDNGAAGWGYSIDYGDGTVVTGTTATQSLALEHVYADGDAQHTVSITVTDVAGESASDSFAVTVDNVAPTAAVTGADTVAEGSVYTLTVGAVTDPGADTRSSYNVAWGDGSVRSYTPAEWAATGGSLTHTYADGNSTPTIVITATDEDGTFVLGTKTLTVQNVAPTLALAGAASTAEGSTYLLAITGNDVAGAADPLSYSIDWGDGSALQVLSAAELAALGGSVGHVFADDQDGPVNSTPRTVTVTANDGDGGSDTETLAVTVNNVAPTAAVTGADTVAEGGVYTLAMAAVQDPGTDTRTGYSIDWGDGTVQSFTPAEWAAAAGSFTHSYADGAATPTIVVSATDEDGSFVLGTKSLTVQNVAPTLALAGAASTAEGSSYLLAITGNDVAGDADPLSYSIDWGDGSAVQVLSAAELAALGGSVGHVFADDQDGPVNSTPRTITVTANDGDDGSTSDTLTVAVNNVAPTIALSGAGTVEAGQTYTLNLGSIVDPGQDTVSSIVIDWGDGTVETLAPAASATHVYTAAANRSISVSLVDEDGTHAAAGTLAVVVVPDDPENQAPDAVDDSYNARNGIVLGSVNLLDNDIDPDGDALTVTAFNYTGSGALVVLADGTFSYTAAAGFTGTDSFTYDIADAFGLVDTATVTLTVLNGAPVFVADPALTIRPGQTATFVGADLVLNDTDPDGDPLSITQFFATTAQGGTVQNTAFDTFTYTPANGFVGSDTFTYIVSDGYGGSTEATLTINVVNGGPVFVADPALTIRPGQTATFVGAGLLANDTDPDGDALQITQFFADTAQGGTVQNTAFDTFTYTPAAGFVGSDTFTYIVSDGYGGTTQATLTINVVNSGPVFVADPALTIRPGQTASFVGATLVANDLDADGDALAITQFFTDTAQGGTVQNTAFDTFTYTPAAGFVGSDTFTYIVSDGYGGTTQATLTINVVNSGPVATDDAYEVDLGQALVVAAPGLLLNDGDADGDALQLTGFSYSGGGTLSVLADGSFSYTAAAGFSGTDSFTYTVSDGFGGSDTGTVTLLVDAVTEVTVRVGDAPLRQTASGQWADAWTDPVLTSIRHTADVDAPNVVWSSVRFDGVKPQYLEGGDILTGDLGVSGRSAATGASAQEVEGSEALRFNLAQEATEVTVRLSRFFVADDDTLLVESGRLRLLDAQGNVVDEVAFTAQNRLGVAEVNVQASQAFVAMELMAGAYDGTEFVFGGYTDRDGDFGGGIFTGPDGRQHGSDFLVDWVEFTVQEITAPLVGVVSPAENPNLGYHLPH